VTLKAKLEIEVELDFDYINEYDEDITAYVEDEFRRALNKQIHSNIIDDDDFKFWTIEKFNNRTGLGIKSLRDLGSYTLKISKSREVKR